MALMTICKLLLSPLSTIDMLGYWQRLTFPFESVQGEKIVTALPGVEMAILRLLDALRDGRHDPWT